MTSPAQKTTALQNHWHVLGAGSIGSLFAFWLKEKATLIQRPESFDSSITEFRYQRNDKETTFELPCVRSSDHYEPIQRLLICTKANQTQAAIKNIKLADNAQLVLLQNGMGNAEWLEQEYSNSKIFSATTTHGAYRLNKNHVVHAGLGDTYLGSLDTSLSTAAEDLSKQLSTDEQNIYFDADIKKRLWLKLAINCAINPLTAIYQCQNGDLLKHSERLGHMEAICKELDLVLKELKFLAADKSCFATTKQVAHDTGANFSSMYQDRKHQQASEIDFIQGYLITEAQKLGIPTPHNSAVLATIKEIEAAY